MQDSKEVTFMPQKYFPNSFYIAYAQKDLFFLFFPH
jgi:hypothetical protein